ncbi:MAG TPA: hypothetical protein PLQ35_09540 [bacterium]|nr:hypothetical protein [bacterium]HQL62525.1 hypothetical protein [bacterium]
MKKRFCLWTVGLTILLVPLATVVQSASSPEEAGITAVTGDLTPWRAYGADMANYDNIWVIALKNGSIVAFKLAMDMEQPGWLGGSEFLIFGPDGSQLTPLPISGSYDSTGAPIPVCDYPSLGGAWGAFTHGAAADRTNGNGFVVHNQGQYAATLGWEFADELGDEAFTLVQLFNNDGTPRGTSINAFGTLTAEEGGYRDIGAVILSNGDIVAIGEDRQQSDDAKDAAGLVGGEAVVAVILGPDGTQKKAPFLVHTDENGQYIGTGNSSVVYQNIVAFDGGFMIDHGLGMRWYNNDGTPRTPSMPDHESLAGVELVEGFAFTFGTDSGGRGDSSMIASNGKDLVVKSVKVESGNDAIGALIYYNVDGSVRNWVRFDESDLVNYYGLVDRTSVDMDENGNVFVVWQDGRFGEAEGELQIFGRFFDKNGNPHGGEFPVFKNYRTEPSVVDYGPYGQVPAGDIHQPRCAINSQVAAVMDGTTIVPGVPDLMKQLAKAFGLPLNDPVLRIFENPLKPVDIQDWSIY